MANIRKMPRYEHALLAGTSVYGLDEKALVGTPQEVVVVCGPHAVIKPHRHAVDAAMFIVAGEGEVLSSDVAINGRQVACGDVVCFEKDVDHGFKAFDQGLVFISRNGGIVDQNGGWDIKFSESNHEQW